MLLSGGALHKLSACRLVGTLFRIQSLSAHQNSQLKSSDMQYRCVGRLGGAECWEEATSIVRVGLEEVECEGCEGTAGRQ